MNPSPEDLGNTSPFPATSKDSSQVFAAAARGDPAQAMVPEASAAHDATL